MKISGHLLIYHFAIDNFFNNQENPQHKKKPKLKEKLKLSKINKKYTTFLTIKSDLKLNVSRETIRKVFIVSRNVSYTKIGRKPLLSKANKLQRIDFVKSHLIWNEKWKNMVWGDEKK